MKRTILLTILLAAVPCSAAIISVEPDGSGDVPTIQDAVDTAGTGDEIVLAIGTYTGDGNRDIDFGGRSITVRSTNPNDPNIVAVTIIDCQGTEEELHRGFYFHNNEDANSVVDGLTITNGYGPLSDAVFGYQEISVGGAIFCESSSPTISKCVITGNKACQGGGIYCCYGSKARIINCKIMNNTIGSGFAYEKGGGGIYCYFSNIMILGCTISQNTTYYSGTQYDYRGNGGGIVCDESDPIIDNCIISMNSADEAGGIECRDSSPTITNCVISDNFADDDGGGIYCGGDSKPALINCIIHNNSIDGDGGGLFCEGSSLAENTIMLNNCLFNQNSARYGGGISCANANIILNNCTFANNIADDGRTLDVWQSVLSPGTSDIQINNCILWNGGDEIKKTEEDTVIITYSNIHGGYNGQGNIDFDPCFVSSDDYHLVAGSPCINAGKPNYDFGIHIGSRVFNERQIATYLAPIELNESNIDISTIDVTRTNGKSYWEGWAYTISEVNGRVLLHLIEDYQRPTPVEGEEIILNYMTFVQSDKWVDLDGNPRISNSIVDMGAYEIQLPDPIELLDMLACDIIDLNLHRGIENSLLAKIDRAIAKLEDDNPKNDRVAVRSLRAFINEVEAQSGKKISEEDADDLIEACQQIIDMLTEE